MYLNMSVSLIIETVQAFLSSAEAPVGYSNKKWNNKKMYARAFIVTRALLFLPLLSSLRHKKSRSVETEERYRLIETKENGKSRTIHGLGTWFGPLIIAVAAVSSNNLQTLIKNTLKALSF